MPVVSITDDELEAFKGHCAAQGWVEAPKAVDTLYKASKPGVKDHLLIARHPWSNGSKGIRNFNNVAKAAFDRYRVLQQRGKVPT